MPKVKLIKGLSYSGIISASYKNPLVDVDNSKLEAVLATGYFALADKAPAPVKKPEEIEAEREAAEADFAARIEGLGLNNDSLSRDEYAVAVNKLNRADADKFAIGLGLDVEKAKNKDEVIALILAKKYPTGQQSGQQA